VNGTLPPSGGPGLTTNPASPSTSPLVLDANGNATGGVRSPHLDVPIATLRGSGNSVAGGGLNFCALFGTTTPFTNTKLAQLYPSHTAFVNAWNASVDTGVTGGFILPADAPMLKLSAENSDIGKHVLTALSQATVYVGLKNGDDVGTKFDVRVDLLRNGTSVASGATRCVTGVARPAANAKEVKVDWAPFAPVTLEDDDVLSMRVSTRIGTNPDDTFCGGHSNAVGLRTYYDAVGRQARFDATIFPAANSDEYLHSNGTPCGSSGSTGVTSLYTDATAPGSALANAKCRDSAGVKFSGGNTWQTVDAWTLPPHVS
jgi:hypothetical protein